MRRRRRPTLHHAVKDKRVTVLGPVKQPEMDFMSHRGGSPKGLVHNLLMQFFTLGSSKIEVFETCFFDIVTTEYDHPRYVKHVLGRIFLFFTLFGYSAGRGVGGWEGVKRDWYTTCLCSFSAYTAQKSKFPKLMFSIL